jgi:hypothetical protein
MMARPVAVHGPWVAVALAMLLAAGVAAPAPAAAGAAAPNAAADLLLGTYLGGTGDECSDLGSDCRSGVALGPDGSIYVVGTTESADFPTTPGAYDRVGGTVVCPVGPDCSDAFVARLDPTGSRLIYATYLGGSGSDCITGCSVAVDRAGAAYVVGGTVSSDFPTTYGAPDRTCGSDGRCNGGALDGFVAKLSPDGSTLVYATYLGGSNVDWVRQVAVGPNGAAYVVGATYSDDFPVTAGAFDTTFNGGYVDAFVTKISPAGTAFAFSTFIGGTLGDLGMDIALHAGTVYAVGYTNSYDFPTSPDAYDRSADGEYDAFLVRLSRSGARLRFGTYLGGSSIECLEGCAVGVTAAGDPIVAGATRSSNFPVTAGALDTTFGGGSWCPCDGFVTEFDPDATRLVYSTFLGGSGADFVHDLAVGASGGATVVMETDSPGLLTTAGAFHHRFGGGFSDAYVATLALDGSALTYGSYLGGKGSDCLGDCAIALGPGPVASVAGDTQGGGFPTTVGAFQPKRIGHIDSFAAELDIAPGSRAPD